MLKLNKGHNPVGDLISHLRQLFSRFADTSVIRIGTEGTNVTVKYNTKHRSMVMFCFMTPDDIKVDIKVDLNDISKEYIALTVSDLQAYLEGERQRRQQTVLADIRSPIASAVEAAKIQSGVQ